MKQDESNYVHLMIQAMLGKTAMHLREVHGVEPTDDKRENAGLHLDAHGIPRDVRWAWSGRRFQITGGRFVQPKEEGPMK